MKTPSEVEINPYGDQDGGVAVQNWLGKTIEEGVAIIARNPIRYQEDFSHMGIQAFGYYIESVWLYLRSDSSRNEEDFIHGILQAIQARIEECGQGQDALRAVGFIASIANYALENADKFYSEESFLRTKDLEVAKELIARAG